MITGRVIGGIIALFGGIMVVLALLLNTAAMSASRNSLVAWIVNLIIGLWAISGGILGIYKQGTGSLIALIAGLAAIFLEVLYYINPVVAPYLYQYMPLEMWWRTGPVPQ